MLYAGDLVQQIFSAVLQLTKLLASSRANLFQCPLEGPRVLNFPQISVSQFHRSDLSPADISVIPAARLYYQVFCPSTAATHSLITGLLRGVPSAGRLGHCMSLRRSESMNKHLDHRMS